MEPGLDMASVSALNSLPAAAWYSMMTRMVPADFWTVHGIGVAGVEPLSG